MRPIALLNTLVRIQGRLRRPLAARWEDANPREYFWAGRGRGSDKCVWMQAAWAEWASARGFKVATCFYDLFKAFEKVGFQRLMQEECRTGFPVRQMKLLVFVYSAARVLDIGGALSFLSERSRPSCRGVRLLRRCSASCSLVLATP